MSSPLNKSVAMAAVIMMIFSGCQPGRPFYVHENADLQYYVDQQVDVRYPDAAVGILPEVTQAAPPLTLNDQEITDFMDLTLEDAVNIALKNTKTIRATGRPTQVGFTIQGTTPGVIDNPDAPTIYEVGIRESEPSQLPVPGQITSAELLSTNSTLDTNQGVEAALAEFDAHVTSSLFWNTTDRPRNFVVFGEQRDNEASNVGFQHAISKKAATGTLFTLRSRADFSSNNNFLSSDPPPNTGNQALESDWTAALELEFNQPLLRGRGTAVNRTPILVARIGGDQTVANTEFFLQNMLTQIEIAYWGLYNSYRQFEVAKESVDNAIKVYNIEKDNFEIGGSQRSTKATVSRAAEQYFNFVGNLNSAYAEMQRRETDLRFLLGISSSDGKFIRPVDVPITSEIAFDWYESLNEALIRRPNLRIKQWEIKKKELALNYSKNGLLGQLNFVFLYRFLGLGDELIGGDGLDFPATNSGAVENLFGGDSQELRMGLTGGYTVGQRREMMNVRNAQLKLARERARLEDMELDVARELQNALKALVFHYKQARVNANRWLASQEEVRTYADLRDQGIDITNVLEAQRNEAQARVAFHDSIANYNQFVALIHRLRGTTLEYYNVQFGEGQWPEKAYYDAEELARKRSASLPMNYGFTRPGTVSISDGSSSVYGEEVPMDGTLMGDEMIEGEMILEGPLGDGELVPLKEIEEIQPRVDPPSTPKEPGFKADDRNITKAVRGSEILQASYLEAEAPEKKNIRWSQLGLADEGLSSGTRVRTKAKLRLVGSTD